MFRKPKGINDFVGFFYFGLSRKDIFWEDSLEIRRHDLLRFT